MEIMAKNVMFIHVYSYVIILCVFLTFFFWLFRRNVDEFEPFFPITIACLATARHLVSTLHLGDNGPLDIGSGKLTGNSQQPDPKALKETTRKWVYSGWFLIWVRISCPEWRESEPWSPNIAVLSTSTVSWIHTLRYTLTLICQSLNERLENARYIDRWDRLKKIRWDDPSSFPGGLLLPQCLSDLCSTDSHAW